MSKVLKCRDVGPDCDFVVRGESEEEILQKAAAHAKAAHGMEQIPPELVAKARSVIRDE